MFIVPGPLFIIVGVLVGLVCVSLLGLCSVGVVLILVVVGVNNDNT